MRLLQFCAGNNKIFEMFICEMPSKFNWRKMLPHLTKLVNQFGLKQKDVSFTVMEYIAWDFSEDEPLFSKEQSLRMEKIFKLALKGEDKLGSFHLVKYTEGTGFEILRPATKRAW